MVGKLPRGADADETAALSADEQLAKDMQARIQEWTQALWIPYFARPDYIRRDTAGPVALTTTPLLLPEQERRDLNEGAYFRVQVLRDEWACSNILATTI